MKSGCLFQLFMVNYGMMKKMWKENENGATVRRDKKCDKLINSFWLRGNKFVEYACFQYGAYNVVISGEPDAHYISDFLYFEFLKSTKILKSIRMPLDIGRRKVIYQDETAVCREIKELIESIVVHADKTIELRWKFSNRSN